MRPKADALESVVAAARNFFYFCAVTQLLSGLIIVMASVLRGLRDTNAVLWLDGQGTSVCQNPVKP
jgi:Na+-driven multidrug efflux pump